MIGLSPQSLMVLVEVMDREIGRLEQERDAAEEPEYSDYEELLLTYSQVEEEVRQAYAAAAATSDNLPSLASLLRKG